MLSRTVRCIIATAALPAAVAGAQADSAPSDCIPDRHISWSPRTPVAGTLFRVRVVAAPDTGWRASLGGEALHFAETRGDTIAALAPVPIDSAHGLTLTVSCDSGAPRTTTVRVPTAAGKYPSERLSVDPRFATPPDSALAARIRDEAARAATVSEGAHQTPRLWREPFAPPRPGRVTSGFGRARMFNGTLASRHMGTDFAGQTGATVRAVNNGVVRLVDRFYYGGNVVYVDHGAGLVTAYLHLSETLVAAGDTVSRGALIGRVGATGRVTGPHLHLIARYGDVTVDAMSLFPATPRAPAKPPRRPASRPPRKPGR